MAYPCTNSKGEQYSLHATTVTLQHGTALPVYYFRREPTPHPVLDVLPEGHPSHAQHSTRRPSLKRTAMTEGSQEGSQQPESRGQ